MDVDVYLLVSTPLNERTGSVSLTNTWMGGQERTIKPKR